MRLTSDDIAQALGEAELSNLVREAIERTDLHLRSPSAEEREGILLSVLGKIREDLQVVGEPARTDVWNKGWGENLEDFKQNASFRALVPKFMRANQAIRWNKEFYYPRDDRFEENFADILRTFIFEKFANDGIDEIHEFGAGTGWNLLRAWNILNKPTTVQLVGSDFVPSAVELMSRVGVEYGAPIEARLFDMKNPDESYSFSNSSSSGVFTFGSLEQLAGELDPMFDFLIRKKPAIVISIEPASETYDSSNLVDFTALWFQTKRGYTSGMIALLQSLENKGLIRIDRIKRIGFGSTMMEGYNLFIWRPL